MMLSDLKPYFFTMQNGVQGNTESIVAAAGVVFTCPTCLNHLMSIPFIGHTYDHGWNASGTSISDLTLTPSIWHHCESDPHFFITAGEIVMA